MPKALQEPAQPCKIVCESSHDIPMLKKIKSFLYYAAHSGWPLRPETFEVHQYTTEELERFKSEFTARHDRRFRKAKIVGAFFVTVALIAFLAGSLSTAILSLGIGAMASSLVCWYGRNRRCPSCYWNIDHSIGLYCPCCGSKTLEKGPECFICTSCKGRLTWEPTRGHPRRYKLHACSVCGVWLHDDGIW